MDNLTERMYEFMKAESNRLKTFQMNPPWPKDYVDIKKLAKAGFFYAFNGDDVHCAFCRGQVRRWNRDDDPMTEHAKHFTTCPFIMGGEVGNQPLGEDPFPGAKRPRPYDVCGAHPNYPPNDPRSLEEQQESLQQEQPSVETDQESTGSSEQNFTTDTENPSIDGVEEEDPHHSQSVFLDDLARYDYRTTNQIPQQPSMSQESQRHVYMSNPPSSNHDERVSFFRDSNCATHLQNSPQSNNSSSASSENLNGICKICYTNSIELVFLPCGHSVSCLSCARQLLNCPCCRSNITTRIRTFLV